MKLRWTRSAVADLTVIQDYIERDRPEAAQRVAAEILSQVESLLTHPTRGRAGQVAGTCELAIGRYPYVVAYRIHAEEIQVLRVLHDRRNWPSA